MASPAENEELLRTVEIPPGSLKTELREAVEPFRELVVTKEDPFEDYRGKSFAGTLLAVLKWLFPIIEWVRTYKLEWLLGDIIAGLTIASLAVPQDLGYAGLAKVPPINGLYSSFLPPTVYSIFGTSRHIAIGPTAVVSLLIGTLLTPHVNYEDNAALYLQLAITVNFFSGIISLGMGVLRLGWIIDFLSHAAVVGFMAGAAITIALQQLKGLLGYTQFTNETNIISVLEYVFTNLQQFNWRAFLFGITQLIFLMSIKYIGKYLKKRKLKPWDTVFFFLNALGPLTCVVVSTLIVWLAKLNKLVPCVKQMPQGLSNLPSADELLLTGQWTGTAAYVGIVVGLIAMTEAVAIARTFAAMEGYHINGNKEMIAYGVMNLVGSVTSSITTTGSFSRSAVNHNAGGKTMLTNILMSLVVLVTLLWLTQVFIYLPSATLAAIIMNAVLGLIDFDAAKELWKVDKVDFVVMLGTFLGVLFNSVEVGILVGVCISMIKVLVLVTRPAILVLGEIPGTSIFGSVSQYRYAKATAGILTVRVDAPILFTNSNFVRDKLEYMVSHYEAKNKEKITHLILDFTSVTDIDTTGIHSLEELLCVLNATGVQLGIASASKAVLRKLGLAGFTEEIGHENLFLSVAESNKVYTAARLAADASIKIKVPEDGAESKDADTTLKNADAEPLVQDAVIKAS